MEAVRLDTFVVGTRLCDILHWLCFHLQYDKNLAHQNRTIAIASDLRVDGAKSPEIPQKEGVLGSEIAARNRRSLATFHRILKSQCIIAVSCLGNRAISGVRDGHRNRKSQQSLRFWCAKDKNRILEALVHVPGVLRDKLPCTTKRATNKQYLYV